MLVEVDTLVLHIVRALGTHGLSLEPVSSDYIKEGGTPFNLLQKYNHKLVVSTKLANLKSKEMSHSVAWDDRVIADSPHNCVVNETYDRINSEKSRLGFLKLYPLTEFKRWQITSVYELHQCKHQSQSTTYR